MSETSTTAGERVEITVNDECCGNCGGELPTADEQREITREMIEAMTADIAANPDLAAKLWVVLKMAAEPKR